MKIKQKEYYLCDNPEDENVNEIVPPPGKPPLPPPDDPADNENK